MHLRPAGHMESNLDVAPAIVGERETVRSIGKIRGQAVITGGRSHIGAVHIPMDAGSSPAMCCLQHHSGMRAIQLERDKDVGSAFRIDHLHHRSFGLGAVREGWKRSIARVRGSVVILHGRGKSEPTDGVPIVAWMYPPVTRCGHQDALMVWTWKGAFSRADRPCRVNDVTFHRC